MIGEEGGHISCVISLGDKFDDLHVVGEGLYNLNLLLPGGAGQRGELLLQLEVQRLLLHLFEFIIIVYS